MKALAKANVTDIASLTRVWHTLMIKTPPPNRSLWVLFIHPDGSLLNPIGVVGELEKTTDKAEADLYVSTCRTILSTMQSDSSVAFAVARPDAMRVGSTDQRWAELVRASCERWGVNSWPVALALGSRIVLHEKLAA